MATPGQVAKSVVNKLKNVTKKKEVDKVQLGRTPNDPLEKQQAAIEAAAPPPPKKITPDLIEHRKTGTDPGTGVQLTRAEEQLLADRARTGQEGKPTQSRNVALAENVGEFQRQNALTPIIGQIGNPASTNVAAEQAPSLGQGIEDLSTKAGLTAGGAAIGASGAIATGASVAAAPIAVAVGVVALGAIPFELKEQGKLALGRQTNVVDESLASIGRVTDAANGGADAATIVARYNQEWANIYAAEGNLITLDESQWVKKAKPALFDIEQLKKDKAIYDQQLIDALRNPDASKVKPEEYYTALKNSRELARSVEE